MKFLSKIQKLDFLKHVSLFHEIMAQPHEQQLFDKIRSNYYGYNLSRSNHVFKKRI